MEGKSETSLPLSKSGLVLAENRLVPLKMQMLLQTGWQNISILEPLCILTFRLTFSYSDTGMYRGVRYFNRYLCNFISTTSLSDLCGGHVIFFGIGWSSLQTRPRGAMPIPCSAFNDLSLSY